METAHSENKFTHFDMINNLIALVTMKTEMLADESGDKEELLLIKKQIVAFINATTSLMEETQ